MRLSVRRFWTRGRSLAVALPFPALFLLALAGSTSLGAADGEGRSGQAAGGGEAEPSLESRWRSRPIRPYPPLHNDGLYSTLAAVISIGAPEIKRQKKFKVEVKGFKSPLEVYGIIQDKKAPLVVVLVGVDGKANTPLGRLYPYWLDMSGFNVLTFDSTFRPTFTYSSRHGVSGNIDEDSQAISGIIASFLKDKEVKDKVSQIGVLGYSLGGLQALALARLAHKGELPFKLNGAVALSPVIRLKSTAMILDDFYAKDRWKYTMIDMGKTFLSHEPVRVGEKIPFEPAFMRAGIGFLVREEFTEIVEKNDRYFKLNLIPDEHDDPTVNRVSEAQAWGFTRFMEKMSFPYWQKRGKVAAIDELWTKGDLSGFAKDLPPYARVLVCEDDPFVSPEDIELLKKAADPKVLVPQKLGGHLGYVGSGWDYDYMVRMFLFGEQ